jgi:hypothetical protein
MLFSREGETSTKLGFPPFIVRHAELVSASNVAQNNDMDHS